LSIVAPNVFKTRFPEDAKMADEVAESADKNNGLPQAICTAASSPHEA
jgi:hypothetical protein